MDIIQELTIDIEYLQSLYICEPILQWFIDEDIAECDKIGKYYGRFGKKWNKSSHIYKDQFGHYAFVYKYGKKIASEYSQLYSMRSIDGISYTFVNSKISRIRYKDIELIWDDRDAEFNIDVIRLYTTDTYEGIIFNRGLYIHCHYINTCGNRVMIDGIYYDCPNFIYPEECNTTTNNRLSRVDNNVTWDYECYSVAAGYLIKSAYQGHHIKHPSMRRYDETPYNWDTYTVKNPFTPQIFDTITQMLPPVSMEAILYTPGSYTSQFIAIETYLRPLAKEVKQI